jgi:hypothetical protein
MISTCSRDVKINRTTEQKNSSVLRSRDTVSHKHEAPGGERMAVVAQSSEK